MVLCTVLRGYYGSNCIEFIASSSILSGTWTNIFTKKNVRHSLLFFFYQIKLEENLIFFLKKIYSRKMFSMFLQKSFKCWILRIKMAVSLCKTSDIGKMAYMSSTIFWPAFSPDSNPLDSGFDCKIALQNSVPLRHILCPIWKLLWILLYTYIYFFG